MQMVTDLELYIFRLVSSLSFQVAMNFSFFRYTEMGQKCSINKSWEVS